MSVVEGEEEHWRPVKGFEGLYEVSDLGRVRSVCTHCILASRPDYHMRSDGSRHVRLELDRPESNKSRKGYPSKSRCDKRIHVLVAEAFVPNPDPANLPDVKHLDGDRANNRATNLVWYKRRS
jgi:hypothetical protein